MPYRKMEFLGPEKVVRDYKNRAKLRKSVKAKQRAVERLSRQIEDLDRRLDHWHAGGVTEVYEGFPLMVRGNQKREVRTGYDNVEVWQAYDVPHDGWRLAEVYKLQFSKDEIDKHAGLGYGLRVKRREGTYHDWDRTVMFLSKKDAMEQAKQFVALNKTPPGVTY